MMMKIKNLSILMLYSVGCMFLIHALGGEALAGEEGGDWRAKYDVIMLWINFSILAFVIVKFGKEPILKFLRVQKEEVANEIKELEAEKAQATAKIEETRKALEDSDAYFAEVKARIIQRGETRKQDIIEKAQEQSRLMMDMARERISSQIVLAKQAFKAELVDAAVDTALERLPQEITDEDNDRQLELYLTRSA